MSPGQAWAGEAPQSQLPSEADPAAPRKAQLGFVQVTGGLEMSFCAAASHIRI